MARALLVGINDYPTAPLKGAVKDVMNIEKYISRHDDGTLNYHCQRITSSETNVTLGLLREKMIQLFADEDDRVLFYFAGHGYENSMGGYLVTQDARKYSEGIAISELTALANTALQSKRIKEVTLILDCCHSGHLGNISPGNAMQSVMMPGLTILTASASHQYSAETSKGGLFTALLCEGLKGGAADITGRITAASLYNYIDQLLGPWQQRPEFKTHSNKMNVLRKAEAKIKTSELRQLNTFFHYLHDKVNLDPSWEYTSDNAKPENISKFNQLKKFRDADLIVVPEPWNDLYWAAMKCGYVQLSLKGQLYWQMIKRRLV